MTCQAGHTYHVDLCLPESRRSTYSDNVQTAFRRTDLRRTAARNMRRGHVSEKVAMEVGGWKTTSVFHRYAIIDNQDIADAMNMLEKSQDEQRQRLERAAVARNANGPAATNDFSPANEPETPTNSSEEPVRASRLHHVEVSPEIFRRLHRGTRRA